MTHPYSQATNQKSHFKYEECMCMADVESEILRQWQHSQIEIEACSGGVWIFNALDFNAQSRFLSYFCISDDFSLIKFLCVFSITYCSCSRASTEF